MSTHTQSAESAAVIHPALDLQARIFAGVENLRGLAWDNGILGNYSHAAEDAEEDAAHKVTALVAELVALALGVSEVAA